MRHRKRKELRFDRKHRKHINLKWIPEVFGWVFQIVLVCLCAFVFVWYFGHQISNIGESMNPVIRNGDVVLVNRIVYDASTPKRGDIIVFKPKGNENLHSYIKRIIGLPGESVEIRDGEIYINNRKLNEKYETTAIADTGIASEKIVLGGDAVQVKVGQRARPTVVVHNGKSRAADRVGAAKALGQALGERGLARTKAARIGNERSRLEHSGHPPAQGHGLGPGVGNEFRHK